MADTRMIALCDILGFSQLVKRHPVDAILEGPLVYLRRALFHAVHQDSPPADPPPLRSLLNQDRIGISWFSDTILLYGLQDDVRSSLAVLETAAWLLLDTNFSSTVRLRIGIDYGECHIDPAEAIFVGKAIVNAYRLEEAQEWSGGALTEAAWAHLRPSKSPFACEYPVPLKPEYSTDIQVAVNWTMGIHTTTDFPWAPSSDEPTEHDEATRPKVTRKWRNTRTFHRKTCNGCRA